MDESLNPVKTPAICTVLARGGSKGVAGKNIRPLLGRPLIQHTLQQAVDSGLFEVIAASSDSPEILAAAAEVPGVHLIERPAHLATDTAGKVAGMQHAVRVMEERLGMQFRIVMDMDVTSPLRETEDIHAVMDLLTPGVENVITGMHARRSPYFNMVERRPDGSVGLVKQVGADVLRRQDTPACYDMNASIYAWWREPFFESINLFRPTTQIHVMPEERSWDVDSEFDWMIVETLMKNKQAAHA